MLEDSKKTCKSCRKAQNLTLEQAAEMIGIDPTTLSRYENGHNPIPQDIVASMVKVYRTPSLAWWHVLESNPDLAPFLPEPQKISTIGDLMLLLEYEGDAFLTMRNELKEMFRESLKLTDTESIAKRFRLMASRLMEVSGYLEEMVIKG